jgi:hypothetical protein
MQLRYRGYISPRGVNDPNDFIIDGDICKIGIYNNKGLLINYCIIDTEDVDKCKPYKWKFNAGYVTSNQAGRLHNLILGLPQQRSILGDHKDRDVWNNRKDNLRKCSRSQNACNSRLYNRNTSGYKGVSWDTRKKMWFAQIQKDHAHYDLGHYDVKEDAARAYNTKALELHGEFAYQNPIPKVLKRRKL